MNNDNYDYLAEQVKMTGFGEALGSMLKDKMATGDPEFQINHQIKHGEKEMDFSLNFKKSKTQDNYFFNSYDAKLTKPGEVLATRFYTDNRITAKEAFNLLEGRSVEKKYNHHEKIGEGEKAVYRPIKDSTYNVWVKLDFNDADKNGTFKLKPFGEKWGFDLEKKLAEMPIKQLQNAEDRADLINSLKKGNLQSATFEKDGESVTQFIAANPKGRQINVFDQSGAPVQEVKQTVSPELKTNAGQKQGGNKEKVENEKDSTKKKASRKMSAR